MICNLAGRFDEFCSASFKTSAPLAGNCKRSSALEEATHVDSRFLRKRVLWALPIVPTTVLLNDFPAHFRVEFLQQNVRGLQSETYH